MRLFGLFISRQTLVFIGQYTGLMLALNLVWEIAHLPLYTLWENPDLSGKAFAVIHCTIGDGMIAAATLVLARAVFGNANWPLKRYWHIAFAALLLGVVYTVFSEWLNVSVRGSWEYRAAMPTLPPLGTGLSPLLQWIILPLVSFVSLQKSVRHTSRLQDGGS